MDIFSLRTALAEDYESFTESFARPRNAKVRAFLDGRLADADQWPSLNPCFERWRTPAKLLGLAQRSTVASYQRYYPSMTRPVIDLGQGRRKLWLGAEIKKWRDRRAAPTIKTKTQ